VEDEENFARKQFTKISGHHGVWRCSPGSYQYVVHWQRAIVFGVIRLHFPGMGQILPKAGSGTQRGHGRSKVEAAKKRIGLTI
jgi:hypothetical protein